MTTASKAFQAKIKAQQQDDRRQQRLQQLRDEQQAELDQQLADEARDEQRRADALARDKELSDAADATAAKHAAFLAAHVAATRASRKAEAGRAAKLIALHDAQRTTRAGEIAAQEQKAQTAAARRAEARAQARVAAQSQARSAQHATAAKNERAAADAGQQRTAAAAAGRRADAGAAARASQRAGEQQEARRADRAAGDRSAAAGAAGKAAAIQRQRDDRKAAGAAQTASVARSDANSAQRRSADRQAATAQTRQNQDRAAARDLRSRAAASDERRRSSQQALRAAAARATSASRPAFDVAPLPWLDASAAGLVDVDGNPVWLRGITADFDRGSLLDDGLLERAMTDWSVNVVRLAYRFEDLNGPLGDITLSGTDDIVATLQSGGAYTLLAIRAPNGNAPGTDAVAFWQRLATRYADASSVLFEIALPPSQPAGWPQAGWPQAAWPILAAVTEIRPGSLFFVPAAAGRPIASTILRFEDGTPAPNVVYALEVSADSISTIASPQFGKDAAAFPVAFTQWKDGDNDPASVGAHETISRIVYRDRIAFCANAADLGSGASTRFGLTVRRTFALEAPPQLTPYPLV